MKQYMTKDEWYPVFVIDQPEGEWQTEQAVEVPDELVAEYKTTLDAFDDVQHKIAAIYRLNFKR